MKTPLLEDYTEFILQPENNVTLEKNFDGWNKFLLLIKYQKKEPREEIFKKYWNRLDEKEKKEFISSITFSNSNGEPVAKSYYDEVYPAMNESFSSEFKAELAHYFNFGYGSIFRLDPHIYWLPQSERLEYLMEKTPINNILCYALFNEKWGVLPSLGTEKEIINLDQTKSFIHFLKEKYGRNTCYVCEAIERFQRWMKAHSSNLSVPA